MTNNIDITAVQQRFLEVRSNIESLVKRAEDKVESWRWYKGGYNTDICPFRGYSSPSMINKFKNKPLDDEPKRMRNHSICGFDANGDVWVIRTFLGSKKEDGVQTKIVWKRSEDSIFSFYCLDQGTGKFSDNYLQYFEQYFENRKPVVGFVFTNDKSYVKCDYLYERDKIAQVVEVNERVKSKVSIDELLKRIQTKFQVTLPSAFLQLYRDGRNTYGTSGEEWRETWLQRAFDNPPALMCAREVEWMTADEILDWEPVDYWTTEHRLVPFAGNGCGDLWCFYLNLATDDGIPVVLAYHDENRMEVYARDFDAFLVQQLLHSFTGIDSHDMSELKCADIEMFRKYLVANETTLAPYIPKWHPRFAAFLTSAPSQTADGEFGFVADDTVSEILSELTFAHSGRILQHMR